MAGQGLEKDGKGANPSHPRCLKALLAGQDLESLQWRLLPYCLPSVQQPDFMQDENLAAQPGPRVSQIAFQLEQEVVADAGTEKTAAEATRTSTDAMNVLRKCASCYWGVGKQSRTAIGQRVEWLVVRRVMNATTAAEGLQANGSSCRFCCGFSCAISRFGSLLIAGRRHRQRRWAIAGARQAQGITRLSSIPALQCALAIDSVRFLPWRRTLARRAREPCQTTLQPCPALHLGLPVRAQVSDIHEATAWKFWENRCSARRTLPC